MYYDIAIVIAVYNSENSIKTLVEHIRMILLKSNLKYRIILINDFSTDNSKEIIDRLAEKYCELTVTHLTKNFGQQSALLCGIDHAQNCRSILTIDDDLEQPAETIPQLYQMLQNGYDLVYAIPDCSDPKLHRSLGSKLRDLFFRWFIIKSNTIKVSSFRIMDHTLAQNIRKIRQDFIYLSASAFQYPIRVSNISYTRNKKNCANSGYTLKKLVRLYLNLILYYSKIGRKLKKNTHTKPYIIERIKTCNNQTNLVVLGGSNAQLNAVVRAKQKGYFVILIDYLDEPPAATYADIHIQVSTFDMKACLGAASFYHADGIITVGSDQPVYTAATVAEKLNLPSPISADIAFKVTNKKAMKQLFKQNNIPTAKHLFIDKDTSDECLSNLSAPFVIKPIDSQGQRGIYKLDTASEVIQHLDRTLSFSLQQEALVEEYYPSDEITISCWINDGNLTILSITDRLHYPNTKHIGICTEHRFPSKHMHLYDEVNTICKKIVSAFHITEGPLYIQMFVGKSGIKVNEIACRIGGAFEDIFIPYLTGFDILNAVIDRSIKKDIDTSPLLQLDIHKTKKQVSVQLLFCESCTIRSITPLKDILALPFVLSAGYNFSEGDVIPKTENATARFGHCVLVSDTVPIETLIAILYEKLEVISEEDGKNKLRAFNQGE